MRTLNSSTAANDNNLCMLNSSEATEEGTEFDAMNMIKYYYFLETKIWRICPPILLGKKEGLLINKLLIDLCVNK